MARVLLTLVGSSRREIVAPTTASGSPSFLWEMPFWVILMLWAFLPTTKTPWVVVVTIPIFSKELVVVALAIYYALLAMGTAIVTRKGKSDQFIANRLPASWHHHLPILTAAFLCYAMISVDRHDMSSRDADAMLYTLIGSGSAFFLSYYLIASRNPTSIRGFVWKLTVFLAIVGLVYCAESFFSLGLRSEVGHQLHLESETFGVERVTGPLFDPVRGTFVFLPAFAFALWELTREHGVRLLTALVAFSLLITIIGFGSRAGLLVLGLFFFFLILVSRGRKRMLLMGIVILFMVTAAVMVFSRAKADRLMSLDDTRRAETHKVAWQIITHRSIITNILGSGYGSVWSWYLVEADHHDPGDNFAYFDFVTTPFGRTLFHPHSVLLLLAVEMGAVGLLYFSVFWSALIHMLVDSLSGRWCSVFLVGVVAAGFLVFFDLELFRTPQFNVLWWIYFFGALSLNAQSRISR